MTRTETNPFRRFLGVDGPHEGPAALLGLSSEPVSEGAIIRALQARLMQVAEHPDGLSPEADDVRLALHDAATRLLNPSGSGDADIAKPDEKRAMLEAAVGQTLASMGGWNKRSMERIAALAQLYGVPVPEALELAEKKIGRPPMVAPPPAPNIRPADLKAAEAVTSAGGLHSIREFEPLPVEVDPSRNVVRNLVLFAGGALLASAALIVLSATLLAKKPAPPAPAPAPDPKPVAEKAAEPQELFPVRPKEEKKPVPAPVARTRIGDWDDVLRDATAAVGELEKDPDAALARFEKVYVEMSRRWREATPDRHVAAVDRLVEFLYRAASRPEVAEKAVGVMVMASAPLSGAGPLNADQVLSSAWSAGVLARVERERDLPSAVRRKVQEALRAAFPGTSGPGEATFRSGCVAALATMPARIMPDPKNSNDAEVKRAMESWRAWLDAVAAVGGHGSPLYMRTTLLALDSLLTNGADPMLDKATFEAITLLATSVTWRKDDESRLWLLRWFETPAITSADLYAVTAALAGRSGAEGVDISMVLSANASEGARAEMRDRYAAVWGMTEGESRDVLVQRWIDAARDELGAMDAGGTTTLAIFESVYQLARLNKAAGLLWAGAVEDIADLMSPIARISSGFPTQRAGHIPIDLGRYIGTDQQQGGTEAEWVVRYLGAGHNIPVRRELLREVFLAPDVRMAEVLVQEACRGSPAQVRLEAREVVRKHANEPTIVHALLEFAPMMPATRENSALVEEVTQVVLPPVRHATWRVEVRRALVERLMQLLAGESELAQVDRIAEVLAGMYFDPPPAPPNPDGSTSAAPVTPPVEEAVVHQRLKWLREAEQLVPSNREPFNLAQIERRRRARAELARGRVQAFAAEQIAVCELMAYVCVAEQPARAPQAARVLDELTEERRRARHIFEQLLAGERARMRLWLLRFGGGST
jgi:hypothetical protein